MSGAPTAIVGIGASAGGLEAFRVFFQNMAIDSGLAFVVILHLPAGRNSMLPEILQRWTSMRVIGGIDTVRIEPDCIYVPQPHAIATLEDGYLNIRMPASDAPREYRPIDVFFDSLAGALGDRAIGIVLSGTGTDGALGLKAIKASGGFTIAQGTDGSGPEYDGMPAGAVATGAVDLVAPVEEIPTHLRRFNGYVRQAIADGGVEDVNAVRLAICDLIRTQLGHDFSGYRDKTFMRRVHRRMQVLNIDDLNEYVARLEIDHNEVVLLFRDLLIRVTSFFRDTEAFASLETLAMPRLFDAKHADSTVRVWVPGCATGEEAYSLAILLREQMDRLRGAPKVQIFGTDIDEAAITTARLGRYPGTLLEGLSAERVERFFHLSQAGYVVRKEIRDLCTFSSHSVVRDPPFSRMDLVSCRNLLIYMDTDLQAVVIPSFHYSLISGGILLLGISESTAKHEELFEPLDKAARIFIRRDIKAPELGRPRRLRGPIHPSLTASSIRAPTIGRSEVTLSKLNDSAYRADYTDATAGRSSMPLHDPLAGNKRDRPARLGNMLMGWFSGRRVVQLQHQVLESQERFQSLSEEHETALEELRSANEELHSVNEELQSTNEELETSKEELQSVNEEMHTVNSRLSEKVDELDRANSDLRNLFESTQIATVFLDRHLIIRGFTPAVDAIYNLIPSDHGRPLTDIVSRLHYNGLRADVSRVLETLQPLERRVSREDNQAHYLMRILPYRSPDNTVSGTLVTFADVTTVVQAEQHQRLLVDELNHRVKNVLAVVVSLASQTMRRSSTLEEFSEAFIGRVRALTASYSLLSGQKWSNVLLEDILVEETKPFREQYGSNLSLVGPDVRLAPAGALAFGMAIHELSTNAVKYGALSVPEGSVNITWRFEGAGVGHEELVLVWTEESGPAVRVPTKQGFGTTLITRGIAHELSGTATLEFDPAGLRATLRAPTGTTVFSEHPAADGQSGPHAPA